jgi:hypothetical protein
MAYQSPPEPNAGPACSTLGNVIFFLAVVALIVGFACREVAGIGRLE